MAEIDVVPIGTGQFQVGISESGDTTSHQVTVPEGYAAELGVGDVALKDLVFESIRFLLEREPKEQIMNRFELSVIESYFPDYRDVVAERLGS